MKVTDEMLMAYADGELQGDTLADVGRAVAADRGLELRVAAFQRTRDLAKAAFGDALEEPVPARLIACLAEKRGFAARWLTPFAWSWLPAGAAVAGIAFALGLTWRAPAAAPGLLATPDAIAAHLEGAPTGETRPLPGGGGALQATASYVVPDGVCREFRLAPAAPTEPGWRGVACRHDGAWRVEVAAADHTAGAAGGYSTASDAATGSIDAFLDAVGAGPGLDAAAERALRESGWVSIVGETLPK